MKTRWYPAILITIAILGTSCHSAERLLDEGRYDELLSLAQRRMSGKKENKEKYVLLAEDAFKRVTERDMDRIERLKAGNRSSDWEEIVSIAERIDHRQNRLKPFLPLVAENGYQATFTFVRTHEIIHYAENKLVEQLYEEGLDALRNARSGDKQAGQRAYQKFQDVLAYTSDYREAYTFREEARQLGLTHVLLTTDNKARQFMPGYIAELLEESVSAKNTFWTQYYTDKPQDITIDYIARFVITGIEVGPEAIREEKITRTKKIEDGWEYVLDSRGNVAKDSLGNDIKKTKYAEIHAVILKSHQEKGVYLKGRIDLEDMRNGYIVDSRPVHVENRFYHQAQSFFGDERALDQSDRVFIGLLPFPSDESMMVQLSELVRPVFTTELSKCRYL